MVTNHVHAYLLNYLSGLTVSQGRLAGQALTVLPWQRRFIRGAFAPGVQSAALSVARGNGKTALLSRDRGGDPGRTPRCPARARP